MFGLEPKKELLSLDRFYGQSSSSISQGCFSILDALQKTPEHMVASAAMFFLLCCERWQITPRKALEAAGRMLNDAAYRDSGGHYDAVRRTLEDKDLFEGQGYRQ